MTKKERQIGYDIIRTVAIFMVVAIHSNVAPLAVNKGTPVWCSVLVLQTFCVIAVPLFFMVSGALLLSPEKEISIKELYKSRIPKQAIPFAVWSVVYVVARVVMGKIPLTTDAFTSLLYEPAYYQFWFMYTLFAVYLLLPVLQTLIKHCNKEKTEYILILWAIFSILIPFASMYIPNFKISEHVGLVLCEGYIGYFILGYYLSRFKRNIKCSKAALLWGIGAIVTLIGTVVEYIYSSKTGEVYAGFVYQSYLLPSALLSSTGAFLFFQNKEYKLKEKSVKLIIKLSALSIGVYYIHMLVLTVAEKIGLTGNSNIILLEIKIAGVYIISLIGAYIISRIPVVRKILLGVK